MHYGNLLNLNTDMITSKPEWGCGDFINIFKAGDYCTDSRQYFHSHGLLLLQFKYKIEILSRLCQHLKAEFKSTAASPNLLLFD